MQQRTYGYVLIVWHFFGFLAGTPAVVKAEVSAYPQLMGVT